jgi:hypothetical protein
MSNDDDGGGYLPSHIVREMHSLPHMDAAKSGLRTVSNAFGIYNGDYLNSYTQSLLTLPTIIALIGVLALWILIFALCLRCCCTCCKCMPTEKVDEEGRKRLLSSSVDRSVRLKYLICGLALFAVGCDQSFFFGNRDLNSALDVADDAISFLDDNFSSLSNDGVTLESLGQALLGNATAAYNGGCSAAQSIIGDINEFNNEVSDYVAYVSPLPGYINQANNAIHSFAVDDKNTAVWELYGLSVIIPACFVLGLFCKSKLFLQIDICFSIFFVQCLIVMCCAEMVILMGLADFCIAPVPFTLQVMAPGSNTYNMTEYYATCVGVSPLNASLTSALSYANFFTENADQLVAACPDNIYVTNMVDELPAINFALDNIVNMTYCPPYQQQIESLLQDGVCHSGYQGFFIIWVSQYITAFALFVLTVAASISYQYFEWAVTEVRSDDEAQSTKTVYTHHYTDSFRHVDPVTANSAYRSHVVVGSAGNIVYGSGPSAEMTTTTPPPPEP